MVSIVSTHGAHPFSMQKAGDLRSVSAVAPVKSGKNKSDSMAKMLGAFLNDTVNGKLQWERRQVREGQVFKDMFSARRGNVTLELEGSRPANESEKTPQSLNHWMLQMHRPGQKPRTLDGTTLPLPKAVSENSDLSDRMIPKLFRAAYDATVKKFESVVPLIERLTEKLRNREVQSSYSFIKPSVQYGMPTGAKILQVGEGPSRIEVARFGHSRTITLVDGDKTTKLNEQALENTELRDALDLLLQEATYQRTNKTGRGLDAF